jgi:hypothetical protein
MTLTQFLPAVTRSVLALLLMLGAMWPSATGATTLVIDRGLWLASASRSIPPTTSEGLALAPTARTRGIGLWILGMVSAFRFGRV